MSAIHTLVENSAVMAAGCKRLSELTTWSGNVPNEFGTCRQASGTHSGARNRSTESWCDFHFSHVAVVASLNLSPMAHCGTSTLRHFFVNNYRELATHTHIHPCRTVDPIRRTQDIAWRAGKPLSMPHILSTCSRHTSCNSGLR